MYQIRETLVMEQKQMRQNMITIARAPFFFTFFTENPYTRHISSASVFLQGGWPRSLSGMRARLTVGSWGGWWVEERDKRVDGTTLH